MRLDELPIDAHLPRALALLREHRRLVLVAEPGAGKTTRLPRALLLEDAPGDILVLEPRRLAARLSARRVAEELGERVGERVGYAVRFDRKVSPQTRVVFLTEALLTRRLVEDPELVGVRAVVFDEFHERSLHADLGLALVERACASSSDLSLVVMSATLDSRALADYLGAPLLEVEGRAHPVAIEHVDPAVGTLTPGRGERPLEARVAAAVRRLGREEEEGDVLVFLPGAAEIRRAAEAIASSGGDVPFDVAVLHGDMPAAEQDRALRPTGRRKVILATNVAETSITVPGIRAVVDCGLRREARHSPFTGLPMLLTSKISQASATQRAGRAGRTGPGRCIRLFSRHDLETRPLHDAPEVKRADLAEAALFLAGAGYDPRSFPYVEAPPDASLQAALDLLGRLGALRVFDERVEVTELGSRMMRLRLHPRLARVVLEAESRGTGARGCLAAALIGEREIRLGRRATFGSKRGVDIEVGSSDVVDRVEAFEAAEAEGFSSSALRRGELDPAATRAVAKARDQLARALSIDRDPRRSLEEEEEDLRFALLAGFPDRVAMRRGPSETRASGPTRRAHAHGGVEVIFAGGGSAVLDEASVVREAELMVALDAGELRGRRVVRVASAIEPLWLMELDEARVVDRRSVELDPALEQVVEVHEVRYDDLVLDRSVRHGVAGSEARDCLVEAALRHGVDRLWDADEREQLARRLAFAAAHGAKVRVLDDAPLREAVDSSAEGARGFADLRARSLVDAIRTLQGPEALRGLEALAPRSTTIPGRSAVPIRYEVDRPPWIESRLQDFFGAREGPAIAGGRVPLLLHLLAPNGRAVQVTTDLSGFWDRHYPSIRKELMRRYPRHAWPEDPRTAAPSRPGRRR